METLETPAIKYTLTEARNASVQFINSLGVTKERISELEELSIETSNMKSKEKKKKSEEAEQNIQEL